MLMNLKFKMSKKLTAVAQFVDETTCIFSDECSPTSVDTLRILTTDGTFEDLVEQAKDLAIDLASETRFDPVIALIMGDDMSIKTLEKKASTAKSVFDFS